jgi:hypothetical protein
MTACRIHKEQFMSEKPIYVGSGSGPNSKREIMYVGQMNLYKTIRQKIEALPPTSSVKDVLRLLDECEPEKPEGIQNP